MQGDTLMTPDHTAFQVRSSWLCQAGIGRSFWDGLNTGRHEKVPVCCPCSRLAALHDAPWSAANTVSMVLHGRCVVVGGGCNVGGNNGVWAIKRARDFGVSVSGAMFCVLTGQIVKCCLASVLRHCTTCLKIVVIGFREETLSVRCFHFCKFILCW